MRRLPGVAALVPEADIFLVDQFGTLHDGLHAYPGALAALRRLQDAGRRVVLLSNSGKRSAPNEARLARLGFPRDSYAFFLSSGELAWERLAAEGGHGKRCFMVSRGNEWGFLDGLGWQRAARAEEADLVLIAGSEADHYSLNDYHAQLAPAAARRVPGLCTNPDRTMLVEGGTAPGAGRIAALYAALGGPMTWVGKPYRGIYDAALARLGAAPGPHVMGVGDSVEHDVAGAHAASCRAALVLTGIAEGLDQAALEAEAKLWGAAPDLVLPSFVS